MVALASAAFAVAALCAAVMGFAIQRGGTCTVAAVDELLHRRSARRLAALLEASLWVAGGLLVAQVLHCLPAMPPGYPLGVLTLVGAVLLGLGAFVNRACVLGTVARFGSGQCAYAATPIGFYLGCRAAAGPLLAAAPVAHLAQTSPVFRAPVWVVLLFVALALVRLARPLRRGDGAPSRASFWGRTRHGLREGLWTEHAATSVIGIAFVLLLMVAGAWAYTDVLAELAHGMAGSVAVRGALFGALLLGAVFGGWTGGAFSATPVRITDLLRCTTGGALMGCGRLLIPGGNDGLILIGMPLLWPYAWAAFATMATTIAVAFGLDALARRCS